MKRKRLAEVQTTSIDYTIHHCVFQIKLLLTLKSTGNRHYSRIDKNISIRPEKIMGYVPTPLFFLFFSDYVSYLK